jgi:hypothetical protein
MRVTDGRGVEYDVTYDAERQVYVYVKVFKPSGEACATSEPASVMTPTQRPADEAN